MKIVIGPASYSVILDKKMNGIVYPTGDRPFGLYDPLNSVIRIREELKNDHRYGTLWHEIVHAFNYMFSVELSEEQVNVLGSCIAEALIRNRNLLPDRWL